MHRLTRPSGHTTGLQVHTRSPAYLCGLHIRRMKTSSCLTRQPSVRLTYSHDTVTATQKSSNLKLELEWHLSLSTSCSSWSHSIGTLIHLATHSHCLLLCNSQENRTSKNCTNVFSNVKERDNNTWIPSSARLVPNSNVFFLGQLFSGNQ